MHPRPTIERLFLRNLYQYLPYTSLRVLNDFTLLLCPPLKPDSRVEVPHDEVHEYVRDDEHDTRDHDDGDDRVQVLAEHRVQPVLRESRPDEDGFNEECIGYLGRDVEGVDRDCWDERGLHQVLERDSPLGETVGDL